MHCQIVYARYTPADISAAGSCRQWSWQRLLINKKGFALAVASDSYALSWIKAATLSYVWTAVTQTLHTYIG